MTATFLIRGLDSLGMEWESAEVVQSSDMEWEQTTTTTATTMT